MSYFVVEPEVAGSLGARTNMDTTVRPPTVARLHYEFDGWLGDPVVESFPCYLATEQLTRAIDAAQLSGVTWDEVDVSLSDQFLALHPSRAVPAFRWMRVGSVPGVDDFGLTDDARLVVSARALGLLRAQGMQHALVEAYV